LSTIEHNWSTIDSRCFESGIRNEGRGLSFKTPPPDNGKKRPVQLEKIAAQLSTIGAQLIPVVSNPKFSMAIFGRKGPAQLKIIAAQLEHN